jgi:hypothetical protein
VLTIVGMGLRACGGLLLARRCRAARSVGYFGVVGSAGAGELLDREVLVVALEHPPTTRTTRPLHPV